jgi:acid stress-induced BolA-like protein IbaG/YrbA
MTRTKYEMTSMGQKRKLVKSVNYGTAVERCAMVVGRGEHFDIFTVSSLLAVLFNVPKEKTIDDVLKKRVELVRKVI